MINNATYGINYYWPSCLSFSCPPANTLPSYRHLHKFLLYKYLVAEDKDLPVEVELVILQGPFQPLLLGLAPGKGRQSSSAVLDGRGEVLHDGQAVLPQGLGHRRVPAGLQDANLGPYVRELDPDRFGS